MTALPAQLGGDEQWISIAVAAERSGLTQRCWRLRTVALAARGLARLGPPPGGIGKPCWWISTAADPIGLSDNQPQHLRDRSLDLADVPQRYLDLAQRRAYWVRQWDRHQRRNADRSVKQLWPAFQARILEIDSGYFKRISLRTLQLWRERYYSFDDAGRVIGLPALIPRYRDPGLVVGADPSGPARSDSAVEYFYSLYLTQQRLGAAQCHRMTLRQAARKDWSWPPSVRATQSWVDRTLNKGLACVLRDGPDVYAHKFADYIEQDRSAQRPGDRYCADSHTLKAFARIGHRVFRPTLVANMDEASRCIVGWRLVAGAGNQDIILDVLHQSFTGWAICQTQKVDNGRDYDSRIISGLTKHQRQQNRTSKSSIPNPQSPTGFSSAISATSAVESPIANHLVACDRPEWQGVLPELGVRVSFALPYNARAKIIERFFETLTDQFTRTLATFCDTDPVKKPDVLEEVKKDLTNVPTLDDLVTQLTEWIDLYHRQPHRGDGMNGLTPIDKWNQSVGSLRKADSQAIATLMQIRGQYKVGKNGVRVRIGGTDVGFGRDSQKLSRYKGRDVLVAVDTAHCEYAFVFDVETRRLICRADANQRLPLDCSAEELREANRELARVTKKARTAQRAACQATKTVARLAGENRRQQHQELAATGTDDIVAAPLLTPVQTGFEPASTVPRPAFDPSPVPDESWGDLDDLVSDLPSRPVPIQATDEDEDLLISALKDHGRPEADRLDGMDADEIDAFDLLGD